MSNNIAEKLTSAVGYALVFLMLLLPAASAFTSLKIFLLAVLLILVAVGAVVKGKFALAPTVALITCLYAGFGFLLVLRGMLVGAPGALNLAGVHALWPLVYVLLAGAILSPRTLRNLEKTIVFSAAVTGGLAIIYLLSQLHFVPEIPHFESLLPEDEAAIGFYEGYVRLALPGINSLSFVVPFLMAMVVVRSSSGPVTLRSKIALWISLLLSVFVVLVSGRRAITLVMLLTPVFILAFGFFSPVEQRRSMMLALRRFAVTAVLGIFLIILLLRPFYTISFAGLFERFSAGFDFSATSVDSSPDERRQQYFALVQEWYEHPLLGAGLGEPAYGSVRSDVMPWAYELSYLALLAQVGLLGVMVYAAGIVWIYRMGLRIVSAGGSLANSMLPLLVGMTGFLIANATNPYLAKFDGLWTIFLPVAAVNLWLVQRENAHWIAIHYPQPSPQIAD